MSTKEKGYSLNVLIITIVVMLILTTTAIVTMRNLTSDKEITYFMSDLQEVESYVKEYFSRRNTLPIVVDDNGKSTPITITEAMSAQAGESDSGLYYQIDIDKLGNLQLYDYDRGAYILNEGSLKVYVLEPVKYNGVNYYTITDEMQGVDRTYSDADSFEVLVAGNPITWTTGFRLTVSIPDHEDVNPSWSFKYYENGPITAEQFKTLGSFFEYGTAIEVTKNGTYSIYVENDEGYAKVVNVVVTKIDETDPYIYVGDGNIIVAGDDETGIRRIHYKIQNYDIDPNIRANMVASYTQGLAGYLPNGSSQGGRWTYEEAYTGERVDGITPSIGYSIDTYKEQYENYLTEYNAIINSTEEGEEPDTTVLDEKYPQFQYDGVPYSDTERNIVLYVEDYAGNRSVTNRVDAQCIVSRKMLLDSSFIDNIVKPLNDSKVVINNGDEYTTSRDVTLSIRSRGAEYMYITTDSTKVPTDSDWIEFEASVDCKLPDRNGEITVYVFVTANQKETDGTLKYERVSDSIIVDNIAPTKAAPTVTIDDDMTLNIKCNQKDTGSGIDTVEYGYKLSDETTYKWVKNPKEIVLEEAKFYDVKTRATDKAGNSSESDPAEIQSPYELSRTVPNEPKMSTGMKAIVWDGTLSRPGDEMEIDYTTWETKTGEHVTWYNYSLGDGMTDSKESIWANAKTSDGSYWVWIPRFAYKIIYFKDADKTQINGYFQNSVSNGTAYFQSDGVTVDANPENIKTQYALIDIVFLNGTSNTQYREENLTTNETTLKTLPSEYIVHPAFQGIGSGVINNAIGNWGKAVSGIWVAKFEASRSDATIDTAGVSTTPKVVPSVKSWTNLKISEAYEYCNQMFPAMYPSSYSHLMKSSEWGAVSYLAYSAYGRNGHEILSNRSADGRTGAGGTSKFSDDKSNFLGYYAYNSVDTKDGRSGMNASTTGNVYGVYDLAGGSAEFVASYLSNNNDAIKENGSNLTQTTTPGFREAFSVATTDAPINNYNRLATQDNVYGDALYETSLGYTGRFGINLDTSNYPSTNKPFFIRGGKFDDGTSSGVFAFDAVDGSANETTGFRPVLIFE